MVGEDVEVVEGDPIQRELPVSIGQLQLRDKGILQGGDGYRHPHREAEAAATELDAQPLKAVQVIWLACWCLITTASGQELPEHY